MSSEIELKFQLTDENERAFVKWLEANATFESEVQQIDHYIENPQNPFSFINADGTRDAIDYFRVRICESGATTCLKRWHADEKHPNQYTHCDEYEIKIEHAQGMLSLYNALGYTDVTTINKTRKTYHYQQFEIAIDTVKKLGNFIEIEFKGAIESVKKVHEQIIDLLKEIGITHYKKFNRGYVSMLWNPNFEFGEEICLTENLS